MSNIDALRDSIIAQRCYESVNPVIKCPNAGVSRVTIVSRERLDGRLRQVTEKAWGCKEHSHG